MPSDCSNEKKIKNTANGDYLLDVVSIHPSIFLPLSPYGLVKWGLEHMTAMDEALTGQLFFIVFITLN